MISTIQVGEEKPFSAQLWAPLTLPSSLGPLVKATSAPFIAWKKHPQIQSRDLSIRRAKHFLGEETSPHFCALGLPQPSSFEERSLVQVTWVLVLTHWVPLSRYLLSFSPSYHIGVLQRSGPARALGRVRAKRHEGSIFGGGLGRYREPGCSARP